MSLVSGHRVCTKDQALGRKGSFDSRRSLSGATESQVVVG